MNKKTYRVMYNGNARRYKTLDYTIMAVSARQAVEKVYQRLLDANYFPTDDGEVYDCDGNLIAEKEDDTISYDGGYFYSEEC